MTEAAAPIPQALVATPDREMAILSEIGRLLSTTLELRDAFPRIMQLISDQLHMHRGTLVLLDESTGQLRTQAALGLGADDIERNRFALGEGVTGAVVATGQSRIIPDVRGN